ncbi:hypothetical protein BT63DRAFT_428482 [Microthyrium microscopicum]|uniref:PRELI/MSF1 domain-containing protein n=1 Tax=Microthyrium microscopicum TaxID=703497 RepID=A0A6A6U2N1_9PEZI|nr:hypothetical protein BT63DRAFT_428482 [Microthyrium microscopicum]
MVKVYSQNYAYDYPFATVTLAYFLRYPNPYSRHVLSTDVLDRTFDPATQRLYTTRLHLKRSRLPAAVVKLLPRSLLGASANGDSQAYILERSVVDVREGWMATESRNLELTTVLDVIERQTYKRPLEAKGNFGDEGTEVATTVTLHSRLGQRFRRARESAAEAPQGNFLARWSQASLQSTIESIGLNRASKSQPNAMEGMKIVMERLRHGGMVAVLEGMRKDREAS